MKQQLRLPPLSILLVIVIFCVTLNALSFLSLQSVTLLQTVVKVAYYCIIAYYGIISI
jgi:hypothetical protein